MEQFFQGKVTLFFLPVVVIVMKMTRYQPPGCTSGGKCFGKTMKTDFDVYWRLLMDVIVLFLGVFFFFNAGVHPSVHCRTLR